MGGKDARGGFWFQDAMALLRLLEDAVALLASTATGAAPNVPLQIRVEAPAGAVAALESGPHWDTTYSRGNETYVDESKSSDLTPAERQTLYRRTRDTVRSGVPVAEIHPRVTIARDGLTNPEKWHELGAEAQLAQPI